MRHALGVLTAFLCLAPVTQGRDIAAGDYGLIKVSSATVVWIDKAGSILPLPPEGEVIAARREGEDGIHVGDAVVDVQRGKLFLVLNGCAYVFAFGSRGLTAVYPKTCVSRIEQLLDPSRPYRHEEVTALSLETDGTLTVRREAYLGHDENDLARWDRRLLPVRIPPEPVRPRR